MLVRSLALLALVWAFGCSGKRPQSVDVPGASRGATLPVATLAPAGAAPPRAWSGSDSAALHASGAELEPEQRCEAQGGSGGRVRGWPAGTVAGIAAGVLHGGFDVEGIIEKVTPGYDCGGAPLQCGGRLSPLEIVAVDSGGARLRVVGTPADRGSDLIVGRRYALSLATCATAGMPPYARLRGRQILDLQAGAPATCTPGGMGSMPSRTLESWPERELSQLRPDLVAKGGFNTSGHVLRRFVPAPCPPGAVCKPQPPPHVVLGEREQNPQYALVLLTPEPSKIALGPARVSVVLCASHTYGGSLGTGELRAIAPPR